MSHVVCTIHAYDVMNRVQWTVTAVDMDLPSDDETRFFHASGSLEGQGIEDMHTWVRDVAVDIIETT